MADATRGLPLLSGPPPIVEEPNRYGCRKCGKEFGLLSRSRTCNHCGFSYCANCSDHQALMPRGDPQQSGYEVVHVCAYCIPNLLMAASGRRQLRSMPVPQLWAYAKAYGLSLPQNVLEKDEIIEAITSARDPNGCLPADNEEYYRRHSVPNKTPERRHRSLFTRMADAVSNAASAAQSATSTGPPPRPNQQTRPSSQPPRTSQHSRPTQYRYPQAQSHYTAPPPNASSPYAYRPPQPTTPSRATRPRPSQADPNLQRPQPPPNGPDRTPSPLSLDELLDMTHDDLHKLSIAALKAILWDNHAVVGQVLEKDDLVEKVEVLLANERADREREERLRAEEERSYVEQQARMREEWRRGEAERDAARRSQDERRMSVDGFQDVLQPEFEILPDGTGGVPAVIVDVPAEDQEHLEQEPLRPRSAEPTMTGTASALPIPTPSPTLSAASAPPSLPLQPSASPPKHNTSVVERSGLCIICQDEEANMVVVDCGHLAMCRSCSDLVMNSSRECPMCRTRIVTPQRLLRVFRT